MFIFLLHIFIEQKFKAQGLIFCSMKFLNHKKKFFFLEFLSSHLILLKISNKQESSSRGELRSRNSFFQEVTKVKSKISNSIKEMERSFLTYRTAIFNI